MAQASAITWDAWGGAWGVSWGVSWINTIQPPSARGYDPKLAILRADDQFIIEYVEDFLRRQPWRK